jgi:hypothetical protein
MPAEDTNASCLRASCTLIPTTNQMTGFESGFRHGIFQCVLKYRIELYRLRQGISPRGIYEESVERDLDRMNSC